MGLVLRKRLHPDIPPPPAPPMLMRMSSNSDFAPHGTGRTRPRIRERDTQHYCFVEQHSQTWPRVARNNVALEGHIIALTQQSYGRSPDFVSIVREWGKNNKKITLAMRLAIPILGTSQQTTRLGKSSDHSLICTCAGRVLNRSC